MLRPTSRFVYAVSVLAWLVMCCSSAGTPISETVSRIVKRFELELSANGNAYHPIDIERVRTEEWQVKRFVLDQPDGDEDKAFDALCKTLQWKKSYGVHDRTDQYFPKELWELNLVEINGKDNKGRLIQWEALKNQVFFNEITLLVQQFFVHNLERVDRLAGETGFVLVTDATSAGFSNVNMDFTKFKIAIIEKYPLSMRVMYIVDQPWLLNALVKIVIRLLSSKLRQMTRFVSSGELATHMDAQVIPVSLGGMREKYAFPSDLIPVERLAKELGLSEEFLDYFYKTYKLDRTRPL